MTTGPEDPAAAGRARLRAGHADREQAIDTLKTAFVHGQLTKDELEMRAGQALTARTFADLAALTADIPPGQPAARPARPPAVRPAHSPAPARRRPLARAAAKSGLCLVVAAVAVWIGILWNPGGPVPGAGPGPAFLALALAALIAAFGILADGVGRSLEQRHSRRQLPPRPRQGGHALDGERRGGPGHGPVPPGSRTDQARADLRALKSRQRQRRIPSRPGSASRGVRLAQGTV